MPLSGRYGLHNMIMQTARLEAVGFTLQVFWKFSLSKCIRTSFHTEDCFVIGGKNTSVWFYGLFIRIATPLAFFAMHS